MEDFNQASLSLVTVLGLYLSIICCKMWLIPSENPFTHHKKFYLDNVCEYL